MSLVQCPTGRTVALFVKALQIDGLAVLLLQGPFKLHAGSWRCTNNSVTHQPKPDRFPSGCKTESSYAHLANFLFVFKTFSDIVRFQP